MNATTPAPAPRDALLRIRGLSAGYGLVGVLQSVSLDVRPAEFLALVGSNGAGKTTLLRTLSGLLPVQSGTIEWEGRSIGGLTPDAIFRLGIVQVPEGRQLFPRMSVQDNLLMGAYRRDDKAEVRADLDKVYGLFPRMAERRRQLAGSMSGGEQQMCAMARALMARPRLLMVDEMSLGLAPIIVDQLMDNLTAIRDQGVTILLVEQDIHLALAAADRAYVLETGRIVREGPARDLIEDPELKRAYLGV
ncbi:ABC transporter ATP-binding protein [Castellaniella defragrans]|uniref:Branched-chain amino acid transport system ATP-binding protein n=1 Tax=Castellaniella defragrans TaxID=75697 RepID=A0A7W9TQK5_CASDE|nr:ABC transporter ATP-binding protein [Castellaniella defragrans]KAB0607948.1 ABC transporter ATP-binding protein [Castellaniella defragrans]MBB6084999.1 branched-chain amino acid transport system ATP-binding protein [Castellaniella defragrans]